MKPKQTRRERTGSARCFVKRVHDGAVAATVTCDHKPEPSARIDQQLTKTGVLLPQFVVGILKPAGAEVAMEFHLNRPPAFTDDLLREVRCIQGDAGQRPRSPKDFRARIGHQRIEIGGPHKPGALGAHQRGQRQMSIGRLRTRQLRIEEGPPIRLSGVHGLEEVCVFLW
jgi:hypothetical protein